MRTQDWTLTMLTGLALVVVLTGCGKSEEKAPVAKAPASAPPASVPAPPASTAPAPAPAAPMSATPTAVAAVATADGEKAGIRIEVQELKRSSNGLMLRFALVNDSDAAFHPLSTLGGLTYGYNTSGIYLIDSANKKKYLVIVDAQDKCVCSEGLENIQPKSRANLWARFPAPPSEVKNISVVVPHFTPMDDVAIAGP